MTTLTQHLSFRRLSPRRLFSDTPEESLRLRLLTLLTVGWVCLALSWVTGSPMIPTVAATVAVIGHWVSWRRGWWLRQVRTGAIVLSIIVLAVLARNDLVNGIAGDRLPVAEYLLLILGIFSFGLRTRGGLYAQWTLGGLILYFVSERAFDQAFVGFLIVFLGLFLTFFAMAFMEDQLSIARVHWPEGQLGRFWFWLGIVGGGLLVCSALAFTLLPPDYRGGAGSRRVGIIPFMGEAGSLDSAPQALLDRPEADPEGQEPSNVTGVGGTDESTDASRDLRASPAEGFEGRKVSPEPGDVVMHVRSKVTSYWRGRLFDEFDGQTWRRSNASVVGPGLPFYKDYYWQAFFLEQDQHQSLFAGYNPVLILPQEMRAYGSLVEGSTYAVLSQRPSLSSARVRTDRAGRRERRYLSLPPASSQRLRQLANEIVAESPRPFERLWLIVSHLRQHHSYDATAQNQLKLSSSLDEFLVDGTSGTSLDFASATVLLARAAGIPARLAVGYLPGRFDPFSGTHKVRRKDVHAWAEVRFARHGWVSFDGTPRPELDVFTSGKLRGFGGTAYIFHTRVGGGLYQVLRSEASDAKRRISDALEGSGGAIKIAAAIVAALVLGMVAYWALRSRSKRPRAGPRYSRLPGEGRREILQTYQRMERLLRRRGLQPRKTSQTLRGYAEIAAQHFGRAVPEVEWITRAAWSAAYDPAASGTELAQQAAERLMRLRRSSALPRQA